MAGLTDVLATLAGALQAAGVGTYDPVNPVTGTAIMLKRQPQSPDRCVVLNIVIQSSSRDLDTADTYLDVMIQARIRGAANDPEDVDALAEQVATVLNGVTQYAAGTYTIVSLTRQTHIQNGSDASDRYEVLSQFYGQITAH